MPRVTLCSACFRFGRRTDRKRFLGSCRVTLLVESTRLHVLNKRSQVFIIRDRSRRQFCWRLTALHFDSTALQQITTKQVLTLKKYCESSILGCYSVHLWDPYFLTQVHICSAYFFNIRAAPAMHCCMYACMLSRKQKMYGAIHL